jgi:hypothetical protein
MNGLRGDDLVKQLSRLEITTTDLLRGKPILGKEHMRVQRECGQCFYRQANADTWVIDGQIKLYKDCNLGGDKAKVYFGLSKTDELPRVLDGKEVGNYCPYFLIYDAE